MDSWSLEFEASKKSLSVSWNLFLLSLRGTFRSYCYARRIMAGSFLRNLTHRSQYWMSELRKIPLLKVFLAALPYICYLLIFSFNSQIRHITRLDTIAHPHISLLARVEYAIFSCHPHKILSSYSNPIFDIIAGIPYLVHFPLPFLFILYLAVSESRRDAVLPFLWCVGWVNFVAVIFQTTFPTAPPWYSDSEVYGLHGKVVYEFPGEGEFYRLDRMMGFSLFHRLYSTSPLRFGAFPSLHVAMPMIVFLNHPWFGKKFGAFHVILITVAAVYARQHYLVDTLGGIALACIVRLSILKIWSPFPELGEQSRTTRKESEVV